MRQTILKEAGLEVFAVGAIAARCCPNRRLVDAVNTLCRALLGVSWTPIFPTSRARLKQAPCPIATALAIDRADTRTNWVLSDQFFAFNDSDSWDTACVRRRLDAPCTTSFDLYRVFSKN
ncbi:hypothetical protein CCR75_008174 [Bremia lactucae]|uniref:Uncharacterized protein n=1 Tax=Bremia lactucae TaxID=4779 RepID=A0A976IE96_BRELC|nr:hypothetical protein CCR75_008174 [Bremia lactucae]